MLTTSKHVKPHVKKHVKPQVNIPRWLSDKESTCRSGVTGEEITLLISNCQCHLDFHHSLLLLKMPEIPTEPRWELLIVSIHQFRKLPFSPSLLN